MSCLSLQRLSYITPLCPQTPFSNTVVKSFLSTMREGLRQTNKMFVTLDGDNSINKTETFSVAQRY